MSTSLIALLETQRSTRGSAVALQHKKRGLWRTMTYAELSDHVDRFAGGLSALGVTPGDAVAIVGDASPEWIVADLAVARLGGRSVAIAPQTPAATILALLAQVRPSVIIAGDQEQVDLVLDGQFDATLVVIDPRGTRDIGDRLQVFADVTELAAPQPLPPPGTQPSIVTMYTEDGPDGPFAVDHADCDVAELAVAAAGWLGLTPGDRSLLVLSPAVAAARLLDLYAALAAGSRVAIPESPATVGADLVEYQPTVLTLSPRAVQLLRLSSLRRAHQSSRGRRALVAWALRRALARVEQNPPTVAAIGGNSLEQLLVGTSIRAKLGLSRTRRIAVVDAPISAADLTFMWSLRIPVLMTFGGAEFGGAATATTGLADAFQLGAPLPGTEIRVARDGILEVRNPVTAGAWRATDEVIRTTTGASVRLGRRADWLDLPAGPLSPIKAEQALLESPYLDRVVVTLGQGGGLVVVVEPEPWATANWAVEHKIHFSTHHSLVTATEVVKMVETEARQRIITLVRSGGWPGVERVIVLSEPLTVAAGELTTLLGIRRRTVLGTLHVH